MHQAQVSEWGQAPIYVSASDLPPPSSDENRVKVLATGLHRVVRSRAAGTHYSSGALPHVPGVDGVGETDDGTIVYFFSFSVGAMSEYVNVPKRSMMPLPKGIDPVQAAGIVNPAMSSFMALKTRTTNLPKDFGVLIVGVTSASGRVALHLARSFGAKRIVGAARDEAALKKLDIDESVVIAGEAKETDFSKLGDVDVVLDYVYGPLTEHLFESLKTTEPVEYVHIGALSSLTMNLPGALLRSKNITIRGSGPGAWSNKQMAALMPDLLTMLKDVPEQAVEVTKLADVEAAWSRSGKQRIVFVP